jgi:hypothetical protein
MKIQWIGSLSYQIRLNAHIVETFRRNVSTGFLENLTQVEKQA